VINKELAIMSLRPNVEWSMNGGDVENIIWHTPNVEPLTEPEVQAEMIRLEQAQEAELKAQKELKQSAIAKLAKLGLTEDEAKAVIGIQ
jgi:signal transduction histidine kinase